MRLAGRGKLVIQIACSCAMLVLAIYFAKPSQLASTLRDADMRVVAASLLFVPALIGMRIIRWHILSRTRRPNMRLAHSAHSYMAGLALATVAPVAAVEISRGAFAAPDDKASFIGLTMLDKMIDATILWAFAATGLAIVLPVNLKVFAAAALVAAAGAWAALPACARLIERKLPEARLTNALRRSVSAMRQVPLATLVGAISLAALNLAVYYLHLYLITYAFSPDIKLKAAGLFPLITASRIIPSVGGLGVREFVASALFASGRFDVTSAAAAEASLVQFVTVNLLPVALWVTLGRGLARVGRGRTGDDA